MLQQQLQRLDALSRGADFESTQLLALELAPYADNQTSLQDVKCKLKEWLVQNTIRSDPEVRNAVGKVFERRRTGVPAGASGTK